MRIIVPIKQVPETKSVRMDESTGTVIREGVESIINPLDLYAIELALQIKEKLGGEVVALTMGPPKALEALKEAVAMGVDEARLVSDRVFGGSDTWATSDALSEAIRKIGNFDLIICGERATDGDTGQVGPGIAAFLDIPVLSYVNKLAEINDDECVVHRLIERGEDVSSCGYPLLLTVVKEVSDPRLPTLRGKKKAKNLDIPVWGEKDLGLDASLLGLKGSPTRVAKIFRPKVTRECEMTVANDHTSIEAACANVAEFLTRRNLI
ncbi:MAG: electron transfer flavoprotein subunit beta/FixA family protein [Kiritimatiellaeota bacterium]|nr:electron transfer flavoprotein subunit beta/FixA family protein [Kiritimatiellota bacterium]